MSQCATHVNFQLPNENTRVTYLLDAIDCSDAPLQAAMALVRNDTGPTGKMNDFEATASFILPHDPVAKKRNEATKRGGTTANISDTTADDPETRSGIGKTGVELRFYEPAAYKLLPQDQKDELREHRNSLEKSGKGRKLSQKRGNGNKDKRKGGKTPDTHPKKKMKSLIAEAVAKEIKGMTDATESEKQLQDYLVSLVEKTMGKKSPAKVTIAGTSATEADTPSTAVILASILKKSSANKTK